MNHRRILNYSFSSFYFDPIRNTRKRKRHEGLVDFYILFNKHKNILDNICAFHVPYSYLESLVNSEDHNESEEFIIDIALHQNVLSVIENYESGIEDLYQSLINYFCYGEEMRYIINSHPDGGFGIIALFDECYSNPTLTSVVEPKVNKEMFYY